LENKKRYYVSVQSDTVMHNQGDAAYEFEIDATEEEIARLQELFEDKSDDDNRAFLRAHAVAIPYHIDRENDDYDRDLTEIYRMLHKLGTEETKRHIARMGVLPELAEPEAPRT
jgi:formiminotetrahydrofolate cyclodeaminase